MLLLVSCSGDNENNTSVYPSTRGSFNAGPGERLVPITEIVAGVPRAGEILKRATSVVSYWFAIAAFYPSPEISE